MKALDYKKVEGCLDGTNVYDILFDEKISKEFVEFMAEGAKFTIHNKMKIPFFRIIFKGKYTLKGSLGNETIRVILPDNADEHKIIEIIELSRGFSG